MELLHFLVFLCLSSFSIAAPDATYDNFVQCLTANAVPLPETKDIVFNPFMPSFIPILQEYIRNQRFNIPTTPKPNIIIKPKTELHVQTSVICAKKLALHLKIRSGGHDYEGISYVSPDPFTLLDMSMMKAIDVTIEDETAWVQAGALIGEVYYRIWEKSKVHAFPAGLCVIVGIGGHVSGGGYGTLLRKFGLSVDNVIDAKIVDVNGKLMDRKAMGEDLFWAITGGGGGSFGVVVAYRLKLVQVPAAITVFELERTLAENATDLVFRWQSIAPTIDSSLFIRLLLQVNTLQTPAKTFEKTIKATFIAQYLGSSDALVALMTKEFPQLGLKKEDCKEVSFIEAALFWDNFDNGTAPNVMLNRKPRSAIKFTKRKSDYIQTPIPVAGLEAIWKKMMELGDVGFVFNQYGGRMAEILPTEKPFPHRAGNIFMVQYSSSWDKPEDTNKILDEQKALYEFMTPFVSKNPRAAYLPYRDLDIGTTTHGPNSYEEAKVYGNKYYRDNFDRLVKVKTVVDPENFFRNEQSIPPLSTGPTTTPKGRVLIGRVRPLAGYPSHPEF